MNGTSYTFKVKATNAVGTGPTTPASNAVIPEARPPTSPTMVTANGGKRLCQRSVDTTGHNRR